MPVLLRHSADLASAQDWSAWSAVTGSATADLPAQTRVAGEALELQAAFRRITPLWYALGRQMEESGRLGHAPTVSPNASDLGVMLAWADLVGQWARSDQTILVVCDDPWLFRHLTGLAGVMAGSPPPLWRVRLKGWLRGLASRTVASLRVARAHLALKGQKAALRPGQPVLLAYGHPASNAQGQDAYFGPLMAEIPPLGRALHTDCLIDQARRLGADGRSFSLHGFGALWYVPVLPWLGWRAPAVLKAGPQGWLIRRAQAVEGATGGAAMNRWQIHCQGRWLKQARPRLVAWPWENHGWERALIHQARALGIATLGYQHSVIAGHLNMSAQGLADPAQSLPDLLVANGPSGQAQLLESGIFADRIRLGGALRFKPQADIRHDPQGPVFVAVPFDRTVAAQMVEAVRPLVGLGLSFLIKDHPLHPFTFQESEGVRRTDLVLEKQPGVRAVLYAATTVGLEAALAGLPVLRFLPVGRMALDILPREMQVPASDGAGLAQALAHLTPPPPVGWDAIFSPANLDEWRALLRITPA